MAAIGETLARFNLGLAPLGGPDNCERLPPEAVEAMARAEHDRWRRDLEADGWSWGTRRDPIARLHPMLVGWTRLTEAEREKDRDAVRALPELLASVGLALERSPRPDQRSGPS
ncbi:MAG TPA: RyR domain-containing protein [Solirubrobacterales bacterium]